MCCKYKKTYLLSKIIEIRIIKLVNIVLGELWLAMENCTVISKKEIMYLGPFGLATWLWGTVFIDRKNVEEAQRIINATAESIRLAKVIFVQSSLTKYLR